MRRPLRPLPGAREAARQALGLSEEATVFLFAGRLSFHAKANPAPMYQALQRAVLEGLAAGPRKAADLLAGLPAERQAFVFRGLAWMVKMGVAEGAG